MTILTQGVVGTHNVGGKNVCVALYAGGTILMVRYHGMCKGFSRVERSVLDRLTECSAQNFLIIVQIFKSLNEIVFVPF